jgi:hypothetical protein
MRRIEPATNRDAKHIKGLLVIFAILSCHKTGV